MIDDLRAGLARLEWRVDGLEDKMTRGFATLDQKIDLRHDALDAKMSRMFVWVVGIQVTTLAAILAAFANLASAVLAR